MTPTRMAPYHELDNTKLSPPVCPYTPSKLLPPPIYPGSLNTVLNSSVDPLVKQAKLAYSFSLTPDFDADFNADPDADPKAFEVYSLEDSSKEVVDSI